MKKDRPRFTADDRKTPEFKVKFVSRVYRVMLNGQWERVSPARPYRGKAERRRVIRERRETRELLASPTV
jgi:hypothetical protein